jgi:hypothetical protein
MPPCHLEEERVGHCGVEYRGIWEACIEQLHGRKYSMFGYGVFW